MSRKTMWCAPVLVLFIAAAASASPIPNLQGDNAAPQTDKSTQAATAGSQTPSPQPGSIGVGLKNSSADGVKITDIYKNGPADKAGLKFGDLVVAVNDTQVRKSDEMIRVVSSFKPGTTITITYLRKGEKKQAAVTVLERNKVYNKDTVGLDANAFRVLAEQGDADAQVYLGWLHYNGKGVPQDYAQAASWYRKAAGQGNADAQVKLGALYYEGQGVRQNYAQTASWYRKAADQGNAAAQLYLGSLYYYGKGVRQDYAQAVSWYRKAAEQGNADARKTLVALFRQGVKGVPRDENQAKYWETKIFEQFRQRATAWRAQSPRPPLPEEAARERLLAENALKEKDLESAVQHYRKGLAAFDTWPEGWFNQALICGELKYYADAINGMKHYLELVPDSPDAKNVHEQMIIWEDKAKH